MLSFQQSFTMSLFIELQYDIPNNIMNMNINYFRSYINNCWGSENKDH